MPDYSRRERRKLGSLFPLVLSWFADVPREERADLKILDLPGGQGLVAAVLTAAGFDVISADLMFDRHEEFIKDIRGKSIGDALPVLTRGKAWINESLGKRLFDGEDARFPDSITAVYADLEKRLPFEDETFDVTMCIEGIEHISDRMGMLREFRRITRRGGKLIVTTPNVLSLRSRLSMCLSGFRTMSAWLDEYSGLQFQAADRVYHGHAFMLDYNEMRYSLFHSGFRLTRVLPSPEGRSSVALKWLMWPFVWFFTWRVCFLGERKFEEYRKTGRVPVDAANPAREIRRDLMSPELLYGKNLAVEAEAV